MAAGISWDQLTVNELRQTLAEAGVEYSSTLCKRKFQFVDLCSSKFGEGKKLVEALRKFGKLENANVLHSAVTPARRRRSVRNASIVGEADSRLYSMQDETPRPTLGSPGSSHAVAVVSDAARARAKTPPSTAPAFESLAASRMARRAFQQENLQKSMSPTSVKHRHKQPTAQSATPEPPARSVVRAGRFSMPSDDIVFSPTRHTPGMSSRRVNTPGRFPTYGANGGPLSSSLQNSATRGSAAYNWPAVDPEGNPIRWRIRDPFIFSVASASHTASSRDSMTPKQPTLEAPRRAVQNSSNLNSGQPKSNVRWRKRLTNVLIIVVICFITVLLMTFQFHWNTGINLSFSVQRYWSQIRHVVIKLPYCDPTAPTENAQVCLPCPDNAVCSNGTFHCKRPQYRKEKHQGEWICVKDQKVYRQAHQLVEIVTAYLNQMQGNVFCGSSIPPDAVLLSLNDTVTPSPGRRSTSLRRIGYTQKALEAKLDTLASVAFPAKTSERHALYGLFFDEVLPQFFSDIHFPIGVTDLSVNRGAQDIYRGSPEFVRVYYTRRPTKSLRCIAKEWVYQHGIKLPLCFVSVFIVYKLYKSRRRQKALENAICRIITECTSIQYLAGGKGYAVGPRASDIYHVLIYGKAPALSTMALKTMSFPEYPAQRLAAHVTEQWIEKNCEELVKRDAQFCRSVLYLDRVPFYFNKRVIDRTRLETQQQQPQPTHIATVSI